MSREVSAKPTRITERTYLPDGVIDRWYVIEEGGSLHGPGWHTEGAGEVKPYPPRYPAGVVLDDHVKSLDIQIGADFAKGPDREVSLLVSPRWMRAHERLERMESTRAFKAVARSLWGGATPAGRATEIREGLEYAKAMRRALAAMQGLTAPSRLTGNLGPKIAAVQPPATGQNACRLRGDVLATYRKRRKERNRRAKKARRRNRR